MKKTGNTVLCAWGIYLFSMVPVAAMAAGAEGHGGVVVACTTSDKISSVEMLDLFEGAHWYDFSITNSLDSYDSYLRRTEDRLTLADSWLLSEFKSRLDKIQKIKVVSDPGISFPLLTDTFPIELSEAGCSYKQLADYTNRGALQIDHDLLSGLNTSPMQQAAFDIHETLYKLSRDWTMTDLSSSVDVRELAARLFSDEFDLPRFLAKATQILPTTLADPAKIGHYRSTLELVPDLPIIIRLVGISTGAQTSIKISEAFCPYGNINVYDCDKTLANASLVEPTSSTGARDFALDQLPYQLGYAQIWITSSAITYEILQGDVSLTHGPQMLEQPSPPIPLR